MKLIVFLLQLPEALRCLENTCCANSMHRSDQAARQVRWAFARFTCVGIDVIRISRLDIVLFLAVGSEPDITVSLKVTDSKGIMKLYQIEFFEGIMNPRHAIDEPGSESTCQEALKSWIASPLFGVKFSVHFWCFVGKERNFHVSPICHPQRMGTTADKQLTRVVR